ncbi:MAG: DMT family transporter [Pseudomonadota bacterium]
MLWLLFFAAGWGVVEAGFGARLTQPYNLMQIVWSRYAVHLLLMLAIWGFWQPSRLWKTSRPVFQLARSMLMLVMPLSFALAFWRGNPPSHIWTLFWLSPLMIVVLSWWMLRETVRPMEFLIGVPALAGCALLEGFSGLPSRSGVLLSLIMAGSFALYVVMTRSLRDQSMHANLFYTGLGVFLALTPFMPGVWITPTLHDLVMLAGIGTVGFVVLLALDRAAAAAPLSLIAPALFLQPVSIVLVNRLSGDAAISGRAIAGSLLIATVILAAWFRSAAGTYSEGGVGHRRAPQSAGELIE